MGSDRSYGTGKIVVFAALAWLASGGLAWAFPGYLTAYEGLYSGAAFPQDRCLVCHGSSDRGTFNRYGEAVRAETGTIGERLANVEGADSDGEGNANRLEIDNGFQPGWCVTSTAGCDNNGFTAPNDPTDLALDPPSALPTNQPPTADAGGPYSGAVGSPVSFDGSGSTDADGTITEYAWDFGDGSSGTGVTPSNTYATAGTFAVVLTVTDDAGVTDEALTTVTVNPGRQPPVAETGGPYEGTVGVAVMFDGSASSDPDGTVVSYAWTFGDGNTSSAPAPTHTYAAAGNYTVSLTVTDNDNLTATASTSANVRDGSGGQAPVADAGGPYPGTAGVPIEFDGSASWDPDGTVVSFEWYFGDGNTGSGATPTHTYAASGIYTVTLTVTDDSALTDMATTSADVIDAINQPPVADPGGPYSGEPGALVRFDGRGSTDADGNVMSWAWDFGDGMSGSGARPEHAYALAGDYSVTLRVTDDSGTESAPVETTASIRELAGGAALYSTNCADCHGDPWGGAAVDPALPGLKRVAGARACTIEGAIFGNSAFPGGVPDMVAYGNQRLTNVQIASIADYLNSRASSGEHRYVTACGSCHGNDGRGGRADEDVLGEDAGDIRGAILEEGAMQFLACLPASDIELMASFLGGRDDEECEVDDDDCEEEKERRRKCRRKDDCDADGRRDEVDEDDDNDRMPDDYEESKGFNPYDAADARQDADRDGKSNLAEFRAGTDPLDASSTPVGSSGGGGAAGPGALLGLLLLLAGRRRVPAPGDAHPQ